MAVGAGAGGAAAAAGGAGGGGAAAGASAAGVGAALAAATAETDKCSLVLMVHKIHILHNKVKYQKCPVLVIVLKLRYHH